MEVCVISLSGPGQLRARGHIEPGQPLPPLGLCPALTPCPPTHYHLQGNCSLNTGLPYTITFTSVLLVERERVSRRESV